MRKTFTPALMVGILVIASLGAGAVMLHGVRKGIGEGQGYNVWVLFPNAGALVKKSKVVVAGIPVGQIESIGLHGDKAKVVLRIRKSVRLYRDAVVMKRPSGVLGDEYIELRRGTPSAGFIGEGGRIRKVVAADMMGNMGRLAENLVSVSRTLKDLTSGSSQMGQGAVRHIAQSLKELTGALNTTVKANQSSLKDTIGAVRSTSLTMARLSKNNAAVISHILRDVKGITRNLMRVSRDETVLRDIMRNIREITIQMRRQVKVGGDVQGSVKSLRLALREARETVKAVKSIVEKVDRGKGTVGRLINNDTFARTAEEAVTDLRNLIRRYSVMRTELELREDYLFLQGSIRSNLTIRFQPAPDRWYSLMLVKDPRGSTEVVKRVVRTTDPSEPPLSRTEEAVTRDRFKVSIQIHRRWGPAVLRFGLIEDQGGAGVDLFLFQDRLKLRSEIFEFGRETWPRLRVYGSFSVFKHIFLAGGVDDILNSPTRDYFLSAGVRFQDRDLKVLLPMMPSLK